MDCLYRTFFCLIEISHMICGSGTQSRVKMHETTWEVANGHKLKFSESWPLRAEKILNILNLISHGRRNFKDTNPLMSSLLVIFVGGGGGWSNFVGSESGHKQSVKNSCRIWSTVHFNIPIYLFIYCSKSVALISCLRKCRITWLFANFVVCLKVYRNKTYNSNQR